MGLSSVITARYNCVGDIVWAECINPGITPLGLTIIVLLKVCKS